MDYVEELIYYNDISGATLSTEEIDNIINEYRKLEN